MEKERTQRLNRRMLTLLFLILSVLNLTTGCGGESSSSGADDVSISKSPENHVATKGEPLQLSVLANGASPLYYEWYKDGELINEGHDLTTLTLTDTDETQSGYYHVVVSNDYSYAETNEAQVIIFPSGELTEVTLTWNRPDRRIDGSPLLESEIIGYNIYHTTQNKRESLTKRAFVPGSNTTSEDINYLSYGPHYFALSTVDSNGVESAFSAMVLVDLTKYSD